MPQEPDSALSRPAWALRVNRLKHSISRGERALVMWVTLVAPEIVDMLATTGLDAVILDLEHTSHGLKELENLIRAADGARITALVRPPSADPTLVARILDAGAYGIVFPMIESSSDAEFAVACMRYQPAGRRGWGGAHTRHARWQGTYAGSESLPGSEQPPAGIYSREYIEKAEADLLTILIVETIAGVEAIDEIVSVEGVDGIVFGWGDFALASGFDWARTREAAARVFKACQARGVGYALTAGRDAGEHFFGGCFYVVGIDSLLISAALAEAVARAARAAATN